MNQDSNFNQLFVPPSERDRYQGMLNAPIVLVEYGNYQCLQSREMHQLIQAIVQDFNSRLTEKNSICVVFRYFIEHSIYPQAQKAAEAAEAAAAQGQFWQMHEMLLTHQEALGNGYLVEYANNLGLDISQFLQDIFKQVHVDRINQDIASGQQSGVVTAPALFINGIRYRHRWNMEQLMAAISTATNEVL
ncbi:MULTISPECIES: DsbA family protein [unclassified Nostoc]|uniref:DsbA family protein n=1 Tax=unclassified Nostoc TaxID=2593658 RepID=UPI000DED065D|nr:MULTISPECIES: DsbA family protein [unclassified Nostoc]MBE8989841.1 DsbA family protein [Nostoc sp. LEGE 12450]MBX9252993.1 DsbA family protein [Desmonostoc muscorum CCALA 125]QHG20355.1 thioredoxin domain-containing protein [Nostoc sp. ATCC 53789]RCJ16504.1 disulfide bond formation protein DsbA [Nostoc sp. ATCC 53789]